MGINGLKNLDNLSDNELVNLAKDNCHEASVALLRRYMIMVKSRASYYYNGSLEIDDLMQEGILALYQSIKNYNPSLSSFSTFARNCVDRAIISQIRALFCKKRIPMDRLVYLEEINELSGLDNPESVVIETENFSVLTDNIKGILSKFEYKVLILYLHNFNKSDISSELSVSEKAVGNALYRIRAKLKKL